MTQLKIWQYHYIPIKPDEKKRQKILEGGMEGRKEENDNIKYWQKCRETGFPVHCWQEYKLVLPLWKIVWHLLKLSMHLPYNPETALLGIYTKIKIKTHVYIKICTQMFTAALQIAKN